ncbi:MAG: serine hydrolase [Chloroflexi bacterium]|nr:serine hydrolase [Chloroflexota bacterium]
MLSWQRIWAGLACVLVIAMLLTTAWRLANVGLETLNQSRYQRPSLAELPPVPMPQAHEDAGLESAVRQVGLPSGTIALSVRNLTTGATASQNGARTFHAASLAKLPILVEVYRQHRLRQFNWDDQLTVTREDWADGSGVLQARVGDSLKIRELVQLLIEHSDNIAANMLLNLVGAAKVNQTVESMGLRQTRVPARGENAIPTTSADDMALLLATVADGKLIDPATSEEIVGLLEMKQDQSWLAAGIPWWAKLAHKWGDVPNSRHDAGIVFTPHNRYALAVLTEGDNANLAAERIGLASKLVFDYFENGAQLRAPAAQ